MQHQMEIKEILLPNKKAVQTYEQLFYLEYNDLQSYPQSYPHSYPQTYSQNHVDKTVFQIS